MLFETIFEPKTDSQFRNLLKIFVALMFELFELHIVTEVYTFANTSFSVIAVALQPNMSRNFDKLLAHLKVGLKKLNFSCFKKSHYLR